MTRTPDMLATFMKMRAAADDRLVMGSLSGRYNGVVDGVATPLFGVVAAVFSKARPMAGGGFEIINYEQAYFTSLETGEAVESWTNPYTGETLDVPIAAQSPLKSQIGPDLRFTALDMPANVSFDHFARPAHAFGDEVVFIEEIKVQVPASADAPAFRYTEATTLRARLADFAGDAARVPCLTHYDAVVTWRPWMKMGDHPGQVMVTGHGLYGVSPQMAEPAWREATARVKPELLSDPDGVLAPLWAS